MTYLNHPITEQSFAIIDREIGPHTFTSSQYAVVRRIIHSTADFEFKSLVHFTPGVIEHAITALHVGTPIITDVGMVKQGIQTVVNKTFRNPIIVAVDHAPSTHSGTRSEAGMRACLQHYPNSIVVIGNAPTALLTLCKTVVPSSESSGTAVPSPAPTFVIGAPVGFVAVEHSKHALSQTKLPHIRINGRKGGSPVAAAILNALLILAWEQHSTLG